MDLGLAGRVAVVTGAGSGIGLATCAALAAEGMHVVGASRRKPERVIAGVEHLQLDLTERDATDGDWAKTFALNMTAGLRATHAALPHLEDGGGVVANVSSVNGVLPEADVPEYCASKAAMVSWSKALSKEYAARGVRVVTISPGLTRTPMWLGPDGFAVIYAEQTGSTAAEVENDAASQVPMGRFAEPEEIADVITFLVSARASYVTGTDVFVDGGITPTI